MTQLTLKQVCELLGVTRRAVQGYEKANLVAPSDRNERGHLLYDDEAVGTIRQIRQLQLLGFSIKEIKALQKLSESELKQVLQRKMTELHHERKEQENLLEMLAEWIEKLSGDIPL